MPVAFRNSRERFKILRRIDRLLDPERLRTAPSPPRALGLGRRPGAIGIDHQRNARSPDVARGSDGLGLALMQLDLPVAALKRARGVALQVLGIAIILQQRGIAFDVRALGAAEQRRYRDALELAADVPERDVQSRQAR